ncbi:FAD-dependent oxidoreductase [Chelatococcus reniformis]|uniref:UDP-galactopyranose mutase n=1 Tax=Chelatococcus reniformis TaxID=1494448 RepID=A0A916U262_9HYPH|nr:FAD-dependent oxidoreductase [Chelatococcus reniformis]GGC53946.1 UDP-galactopyranose mutase [Chelatococcus reniformis]
MQICEPGDRALVVGAGFAGAVHARVLAEAGLDVTVIERRPHVAGNAYDGPDDRGVRVHWYGPHLFHTNNAKVVRWLERFGSFVPYEHRVSARVDDRLISFPVNRRTLEEMYDVSLPTDAAVSSLLDRLSIAHPSPRNAGEYLESRLGREITDLFFRPYTKKMWGMELEELDAAVVKRIPIRLDGDDRYFPNDRFQLLPAQGYTQIIARMLDHERINVTLGAAFAPGQEDAYDCAFLSCPIDEYFGFRFGELPYRSIRFHHQAWAGTAPPTSVVNYTDDGPLTRETYWHLLPGHDAAGSATKTRTTEEPCDYKDNGMERYYPVRDAKGEFAARYRRYAALAEHRPSVRFIGRCGTYTYLDMHQVINQSLMSAHQALGAGYQSDAA